MTRDGMCGVFIPDRVLAGWWRSQWKASDREWAGRCTTGCGRGQVYKCGYHHCDAGELPKRKHITYRTRRKLKIKKCKVVTVHAMKVCWGGRRCSSTASRLGNHWIWCWAGPTAGQDFLEKKRKEKKNPLTVPGLKVCSVQPVAWTAHRQLLIARIKSTWPTLLRRKISLVD